MIKNVPRGLIVVLLLAALLQAHRGIAQQGDYIATLEPLQGLVQHQTASDNPHDRAQWQTVTDVLVLSEGDRVRTDSQGQAVITFFEGIESVVSESSLVVVSTLALPETADDAVDISLDVLVGVTITGISAALDPQDRFEIHTPAATAAVRGTEWWTHVLPDGSVMLVALDGEVGVIMNHDPGVTHMVSAGSAMEMTPQGDAEEMTMEAMPMPAPMAAAVPVPLAGPGCGDGVCAAAETCAVDCLDRATLTSCGDALCDPDQGEDLFVCPSDCAPFAGQQCGSGTCDPDESSLTCAQDCTRGEYFQPVAPDLCGNTICDATESALTCAADCGRLPVAAWQSCYVAGDNINLRQGPGTDFPVVGRLDTGDGLPAIGRSADDLWFVVDRGSSRAWVASWLVDTVGLCSMLPVMQPPPPPA